MDLISVGITGHTQLYVSTSNWINTNYGVQIRLEMIYKLKTAYNMIPNDDLRNQGEQVKISDLE